MHGTHKIMVDENEIAKALVDEIVAETESDTVIKNPAAVALGRLGGLKGGKARAKKLSPEKRKAIAVKAAKARWTKAKSNSEG